MNTISNSAHAVATAFATQGSGSSNSDSSTTDGTTITSTDFLTLLVTQLKNQDPTQPSDPTEYVSQLVGVNSLQQLIDVNKQLTSLGGSTSTTSAS
ncbi:flagellar hook capping FlgD N-terminal domain-containing protein [Terriglobus sp. RCC_193]|uniref:flagellar hook capping FlgD N-terminal domain-containing protein n=1 Tax=Terriglobus sp. RCC_193 TaxID=3239218 RepID=UPI003524557A